MTRSLSADLRGRVIGAILEGLSTRAAVQDRDFDGGKLVPALSGDGRDGCPQAGPAITFAARPV